MMSTARRLIEECSLSPHPEGGYFRETYRSPETIAKEALPARYGGARACSTAIYFLLPQGAKSSLHRIKSDELWHFYLGGPLSVVELHADGKVNEVVMGQDVAKGQRLQHVVPAGCWFGAYPHPDAEFSFVGCTVAPGFDFADFELGARKDLLRQFPQARDVIMRLSD